MRWICGLLLSIALSLVLAVPVAADGLEDEVLGLLGGLVAPTRAERDAAEARLLELAGTQAAQADRVLDALPEPNDQMLPVFRERLAGLRQRIEQQAAQAAIAASRVTLDTAMDPLADVLRSIEQQTGNKIVDRRAQFGGGGNEGDGPPDKRLITVTIKDQPFWAAVDEVLDQGELSLYPFSGAGELALIDRDADAAPRRGRAAYCGPFRFEATQVTARRSLRALNRQGLAVEIEVAWEPRLRPIALVQELSTVEATSESGVRLSLAQPERVINIEAPPTAQATQFTLPLVLPTRETTRIASLKGTLQALVPGRAVEFRFEDLDRFAKAVAAGGAKPAPVVQRRGGVAVTLHDVRKNGEIWEVHMRLTLAEAGDSLASHRGWVFQNKTMLVDNNAPAGEPTEIEHAGYETTMQTQSEVGIAYLFDLPNGPAGLTWVYETPAAVVRLPVAYELKDIALP